jgi:hypothetical protein
MLERTPLDGGIAVEGEKTRYRVMLESIYKFRQFFVAFVFAILSFSMQFQTKNNTGWVKLPEIPAWILLAISGYFALKDCGGFADKITEEVAEGIPPPHRALMWKIFFFAIVLLLVARIVDVMLLVLGPCAS